MEPTIKCDTNVKVKWKVCEVMRIGELSRQTGASPRAIRYYEQTGLLASERRSNGYREFDASAIQTVITIRTLFDLGFPSELVSRVLPCTGDAGPVAGDCSALMERVGQIRDEMDAKARRLDVTRDQLARFLAANQTGQSGVPSGTESSPSA